MLGFGLLILGALERVLYSEGEGGSLGALSWIGFRVGNKNIFGRESI